MKFLKQCSIGVIAFIGTTAAFAASILPSDISTQFTDAKADMVTVFGLAMTLVLAIVAWRYIKRSAS